MPNVLKIRKGTKPGEIKVGNSVIQCAVLEDETRVLSERAVMKALGGKRGGAHWRRRKSGDPEDGAYLPVYLSAANLKPFIDADLRLALTRPILYSQGAGPVAYGVKAEALPKICEVWLKARDAEKVLVPSQERIAAAADALMRGLAHVGIIALVDEATGFQPIRDKEALQAILDKYLRKELAVWAKTFPDEFYEQMFRLRGWQWKGMHVNRPQVVAHYTKDLVYERLTPKLLEELERLNPKNERGRRPAKHFMWLTDDVGHPALTRHLYAVVGFMRASTAWDQFYRMLQRAYPKKGTTLDLPYTDSPS